MMLKEDYIENFRSFVKLKKDIAEKNFRLFYSMEVKLFSIFSKYCVTMVTYRQLKW